MKKNFLLVITATVLIIISSCTRISTTEIGTGLIPPIDGVNTLDTTIDVFAQNLQTTPTPDSIKISKYEDMVLGYITNDPLMGSTQATINAEFKPPYYPYYFEVSNKPSSLGYDSLKLDSVVLVLSYKGIWGDSTNAMNFKIYEIAQSSRLKADSIFPCYSKMDLAAQIGTATIADPRKLKDSVHAFKEEAANQIRIKLNASFGIKLLRTFDSTDAYQTDAQFSNTFRGLSIVPQSGSNSLLRINLQDTNSKIALYYKYTKRDQTGDSTVVRYFRTGTNAGGSNYITRTRTGAEVNTYLNNSPTVQDSLLYLQSAPGLFVKIKTPLLGNLTNRLVHRAELLMEQAAGTTSIDGIFTQPNLYLTAFSNDYNNRFQIPIDVLLANDGTVTNLATFGGYVIYKNDAANNRIASYSFNISRYVQGIITRKEKVYDLVLYAPVNDYVYPSETSTVLSQIVSNQFNYPATGRVRLFGSNAGNGAKRLRIRIIYSKV